MTDHDVAGARPAFSPAIAHFALAFGGFAIGTTEFATMSFLPAFSDGLGVDAPTGGHVISAYALGVVIGAPLLAVIGAKLNRRTLLIVLMSWFALGNILSAFAPTFTSLLILRFLTAVPHGAYFGIAVLVAAGLVPESQRASAIGRVLMGLTVATIVGVPVANVIAQALGWRYGFGIFGLLACLAVILVAWVIPAQVPAQGATPLRELGALRRGQVWLTLGIGAIGFGGLFAVYTYLASTLALVTKAPNHTVPIILALFGTGMTLGNFLAARLAKRGVMRAIGVLLGWSAVAMAVYPLTVSHLWWIGIDVFAIGFGGGLGTLLQMRLMDVAGDAQGLAAALNHSAFNVANALGPWLGGLAIAAGCGWASTGWAGCGLALGGLAVWAVALITACGRAQNAEVTR
jgi:DHA1 family inner membrane transport protein